MIAMDFGCLPTRLELKAGDIAVTTRADFDLSMELIARTGLLHDGWMYPPLPRRVGDRYEPHPYPEPRFLLPLTHELRHDGAPSIEQLHFLISAIGFLLGYRLLPDGHGHLQRTPMRSGLATDLTNGGAKELAICLPHIEATWAALRAEQRLGLSAVITAYQTALAYHHRFEQLTFLYSALDAVWRFHRIERQKPPKGGTHSERPQWLCSEVLGIPIPDWAQSTGRGSASLADARNMLTHEALYGGAPLGHAASKEALIDVQALVSRAVVKALGIPCGYVGSPSTTQQMHGLDLIK